MKEFKQMITIMMKNLKHRRINREEFHHPRRVALKRYRCDYCQQLHKENVTNYRIENLIQFY